ncbi:MAG: sigma-70 family RNA polymerase sigma factor [Anaerolineae bacterium]|nr:sigma-70 family RNA polymerase sigma factor [Anaerolineae bacterium]
MTGLNIPADRNYAEADDVQLADWAKDDTEAFGELYTRYIKKIYNYVYYRTGNHHDAEDLTSRVFYRALAHITNYQDRGVPFSAWLYRIAHNLVANWHRDRDRRKIIPLDDYITSDGGSNIPESATESQEETEFLLKSIQDLPEDRQQLLILKFVERLSNAEIGEIMDRTEGAIKSLYHRTLLSLRGYMDQTNDESGASNKGDAQAESEEESPPRRRRFGL